MNQTQTENRRAEVLRKLEETGLDELPEIFNQLRDLAYGVRVLVRVDDPKPYGARFLSGCRVYLGGGEVCPTCHRALHNRNLSAPAECYEYPPDKALLRYLHEYLAGKAKVKEERQVDPVIQVMFPAIDTVWTPETQEERVILERTQPDPLLMGARE